MKKERARGCLLGLAVGDALGTTYEFDRIEQPAYPALATGPATDVVGGGPFGLVAGQVTDDTQLAVCLASSLAAYQRFELADVATRYVGWMHEAFDIGNQTSASLQRIATAEHSILAAGIATWHASGRRAAGNGSLMRTAPLAIALGTQPEALLDAAIFESMMTHADPRCLLACAAFDRAIAAALDAPVAQPIDGRALVATARAALRPAADRVHASWRESGLAGPEDHAAIDAAVAELASDLDAALAGDPDVYGALHVHRTAGFVRVAFRLAFWHAVHTPSWRDAVVDVASRGGDADTNAAIVGALLGARDGEAAIPAAWRERVLAVRQPGSDAWAEAHHPRHLLLLLA